MILFELLAILLVVSAVWTVTQKSPVYSVVGLLVNFLTLATLYFTLDAEFLGIIQIVIYSGAILMLFVFVIALLSSGIRPLPEGPNRLPHVGAPALIAVLVAGGFLSYAVLASALHSSPSNAGSTLGPVGASNVFGSVDDFAKALFTTHLLPFEATAFVLMVAVVGVVLIAGDAVPQGTRGHHRPKRARAEREPILRAGK